MYSLIPLAATVLSVSSLAFADPSPTVPEVLPRQAVTQTLAFAQPSQTCVAGAHIIIARASTEPQGEGIIGAVASSVMSMVPGSDSVAVVYPATESNYPTSEQEGVVGMKGLVTDYVNMCPGHWIILMGYSQGAQVVADTVIGSDNENFSDRSTNPTGLGKNYLSQIAALIMMGDPGFTTDTPGKAGNATQNGIFPRQNVDAFTTYGFDDKMQTYCNDNDVFCASGKSIAVHLQYVGEYGSSAASFAASKFTSANGGGVAGVSTSAGSAGSTSRAASTTGASTAAATSAARTSSAAAAGATTKSGSGSGSGSSSSMTGLPASEAFITSQRYTPTTTVHSGTFTQLANPINVGGAAAANNPQNGGAAAAVFGAAMFVMGLF